MARKKRTNPNKVQVTAADLKKVEKNCIRDITILSIAIGAMSAHDRFDFGPKRLNDLVDDMIKKYNDLDAGCFNVDDAAKWLADYAGVRIEEKIEC